MPFPNERKTDEFRNTVLEQMATSNLHRLHRWQAYRHKKTKVFRKYVPNDKQFFSISC